MPDVETDKNVVDGRRVRGAENRRKIVEAMLALIGEGAIAPGAETVAARAEVGLRTVFRHFDDMDSLYLEISARMNEELRPIALAPLPDGDVRMRLAELAARRARVFERIMPFKIAADVHKHGSSFLREEHTALAGFMRETLIEALGSKLARDKQRLEALDMLLSFDTWRRLRVDQKLSAAQAKKIVGHMVDAVFDASDK
ncbi:MAG: TetR/AcrR family transcriptional regulator [Parvibaculaceae bacterium]